MLTVEETEVAEHHLQDLGWKVWVLIELSRWRRLDRLLVRSTWDELECWHIMSVYLTSSSYRRVLTWTAVFCTFSDIFGGGVVGSWLKGRSVEALEAWGVLYVAGRRKALITSPRMAIHSRRHPVLILLLYDQD
jgi:hypothetical protein